MPFNTPILVSQDSLEFSVASMAVSDDARRVYLGRRWSGNSARLNLAVLRFDGDGKPLGEPTLYADSAIPLPFLEQSSAVARIVVDSAHRKLYLAAIQEWPTPQDRPEILTVYDLDSHGDPMGEPRSYDSGNPFKSLRAIARHPKLDLLYMVGFGAAAVYVYQLDPNSNWEPRGSPQAYPVGDHGKLEVAVSPDGKRLYLGTYPDTLEVVDLDPSGVPLVPPHGTPRSYHVGPAPGSGADYLQFHYSPKALYRRQPLLSTGPPSPWPVIVWPLDQNGDPTGTPRTFPHFSQRAMAVDPANNTLWIATDDTFQDVFTAASITDGTTTIAYQLGADGGPVVPGTAGNTTYLQYGHLMEVAANGMPILLTEPILNAQGNQVSDYRLRITIVTTDPPQTLFPVSLQGPAGSLPYALNLKLGQTSDLISLDTFMKDKKGKGQPVLKNQNGQLLFGIAATPAGSSIFKVLEVRLDVFQGDPNAGGKALKSLTDKVQGNEVLFLLPGYGFEVPGQRIENIELMSEHAQRYLNAAKQVAVDLNERPNEFIISCSHLMGGQGHLGQLQAEAETVALLGVNTVNAYAWGGIPPAKINTVLDSYGLKHRSQAVYNPLSPLPQGSTSAAYFDFFLKQNQHLLEQWAASQAAWGPATNGGARAEHVLHPGQPALGKVALLAPNAGALCDINPHFKLYEEEMSFLHYALVHAGYTVDFVDDKDVAQAALAARGYTTLYVTGPNVSAGAQQQIVSWVKAGGTLVATLGAAVADEYNTATTTLDPVLGLRLGSRSAFRDIFIFPTPPSQVADKLNVIDTRFGSGNMPILAPVASLQLDGASIAASFASTSGPGVTVHQFEKGTAIAYGFFPGWQYGNTPNRDDPDGLPHLWGQVQRDVIVAPARLANTPKPVQLNHEVVEACRLDSPQGIAVVLLNWTDVPIAALEVTVTVPDPGKFQHVRSTQGVTVQAHRSANAMTAKLPP